MAKLETTVGQLIINELLPEDLRDYQRVLDKKNLSALLQEVAKRYPDRYREISHQLAQIGQRAAYLSGGFSFGIKDLRKSKAALKLQEQLQRKVNAVLDDDSLTDEEREAKIIKLTGAIAEEQQKAVFDESLAEGNPLAYQLKGAGRGNPMNLASLRAGDLLYVDHRDNVIPVPVTNSFSQGLKPAEYWANSYGARKGVVDVKFATQEAGFLCLAAGTLVRMADGESKPIEQIKPGDKVLGADINGHTFPVKVNCIFDNGLRRVWRFNFSEGIIIEATEDHRVLGTVPEEVSKDLHITADAHLKNTRLPLRLATRGLVLTTQFGKAYFVAQTLNGLRQTYDLEVDHPDHLFVLSNGAIVSNSKQLNQIVHREVVTDLDAEKEPETLRGLPVEVDDADSEGALLAAPIGGYKRNTVLTPKILQHLKNQGIKRILVRSPATFGSPDGGIYARDVGVREFGGLPGIGEHPAMAAVQALSEPLSQAQLCLAIGTRVRMADWSVKRIEDIKVGDKVKGANLNGTIFNTTVKAVYNNGYKQIVKSIFTTSPYTTVSYPQKFTRLELLSTKEHKILASTWHEPDKFLPMPVGNFSLHAALLEGNNTAFLQSQDTLGRMQTFDIEVAHAHHLFVLENGLIVSNSSKHAGGVAGASATKAVGGFEYINQLIQVPRTFKGGAAHSEVDGKVTEITPAPAGGYYVTIGGKQHYVAHGYELKVKSGDNVEAGDVISEGTPNPAIITKYKGIGEGRRYFINAFRQAFKDAGLKSHRRNIELLSRGLINHVTLTDEVAGGIPDDVMPYHLLEAQWQPREGYKTLPIKQTVGKYLEKPYLHYTIGTKIRPSMLKDFEEFGISQVDAHDDPPPFEPEMIRGMENLAHDPDWITRMLGSGLKGSLLKAVHHGASSDEAGTSYAPGLAKSVDFGRVGVLRPPSKPFSVLADNDDS